MLYNKNWKYLPIIFTLSVCLYCIYPIYMCDIIHYLKYNIDNVSSMFTLSNAIIVCLICIIVYSKLTEQRSQNSSLHNICKNMSYRELFEYITLFFAIIFAIHIPINYGVYIALCVQLIVLKMFRTTIKNHKLNISVSGIFSLFSIAITLFFKSKICGFITIAALYNYIMIECKSFNFHYIFGLSQNDNINNFTMTSLIFSIVCPILCRINAMSPFLFGLYMMGYVMTFLELIYVWMILYNVTTTQIMKILGILCMCIGIEYFI